MANCPFCGADEDLHHYVARGDADGSPTHWIECGRCLARGPRIRAEFDDDPDPQAWAQWRLRSRTEEPDHG